MSTPVHIIMGITIASLVTPAGTPPSEANMRLLFSVLCANVPDLDIFIMIPMHKDHRIYSFFHYPLFWLLILPGIIYILSQLHFPIEYAVMLIAGITSHFFMDMLDSTGKIMLLAPFKNTQYSFLKNVQQYHSFSEFISLYKTKAFKYEASITTVCLSIIAAARRF